MSTSRSRRSRRWARRRPSSAARSRHVGVVCRGHRGHGLGRPRPRADADAGASVSQEAVIGVVYACPRPPRCSSRSRAARRRARARCSSANCSVQGAEVAKVAALYALMGCCTGRVAGRFPDIDGSDSPSSKDGGPALDFVFTPRSAGVTSSVRIGGVLLGSRTSSCRRRGGGARPHGRREALVGWAFGTLVRVIGVVASAALDLPTAPPWSAPSASTSSRSGSSAA